MSGRFIGYPSGWILGVLDDAPDAFAVDAELAAAGIEPDGRMMLVGPDAARRLDGLGTSSGVLARVRRIGQYLAMDQMPDFLMYEVALREGRAVVGVRPSDERRAEAIAILRRHGVHFLNRFGTWATEEIASWRGPMPEIPQLMRR